MNITPELAEETGWHIGDGSMNYYFQDNKKKGFYQLRGHIEDDKEHYLTRIKPIFEDLYNVKINLRQMPVTRVFGFQLWNDSIVKFKESLGLPLGKKFELQIPPEFTKKMDLLTSCIRGIFDTDGGLYLEPKNHKLYPRVYISTISLNLCKELTYFLNSLGIRTTNWKCNQGRLKKLDSYKVETRGLEMVSKFFDLVKPKNSKHILKYENLLDSIPKT
ncbi:hypothetical protein COU60_05505 [Candidatus Pacearchaeota archaeon CG10_big_fil_rev_8_21_14_0_10_34_76]|nr:MAG: hypothetical protein COU60_05505 [Candidatus Pacearchaeota archaeon CG10_big_fil_rev_8_21_14_0_10_34_76]